MIWTNEDIPGDKLFDFIDFIISGIKGEVEGGRTTNNHTTIKKV
jgi:hypothetical protein